MKGGILNRFRGKRGGIKQNRGEKGTDRNTRDELGPRFFLYKCRCCVFLSAKKINEQIYGTG